MSQGHHQDQGPINDVVTVKDQELLQLEGFLYGGFVELGGNHPVAYSEDEINAREGG